MRTVSAAFSAAIATGTIKITELYILELSNGTTYRYTTHNQPITWDAGDNVYSPIPMKRDDVSFTTNLEVGEVSIVISKIATAFSDDVDNNILERAILTIKRIRWDTTYAADEEFIVFKGFLDVDFNRGGLKLLVKSKFIALSLKLPKFLYTESCNYNLFDNLCKLNLANYIYAGTATGGSPTTMVDTAKGSVSKIAFDAGDSDNKIERLDVITGGVTGYTAKVVQIIYLTPTTGFIWYVELSNALNFNDDETLSSGGNTIDVDGTPAADDTFYELGELEMTSGANNGQQRPVSTDSTGTTSVLWPFPSAVENGDTYKLYPGCDLRGVTCLNKFNNAANFRGFLYVPKIEDTLM